MYRADLRRMDILEQRLRWQKRAIIGLLLLFLFNTPPALSTASKWFGQLRPASVPVSGSLPDRSSTGVISKWTFSPESEDAGLSKTALAADDILKIGRLEIVNESGTVVAFLGYDEAGDGVLAVRNSKGKYRVLAGLDDSGGGLLSVLNSTDRVVGVMGADDTNPGNGFVNVSGESGSVAGLFIGETGDATMTVLNSSGNAVSAFGADANGNGFMVVLSESGLPIGTLSADSDGLGTLAISGGKFRAFVGENGNGAAETLAVDGSVRWSSEMKTGDTPDQGGLLGDLDGDGDVDFEDFLTFAANFGRTSG